MYESNTYEGLWSRSISWYDLVQFSILSGLIVYKSFWQLSNNVSFIWNQMNMTAIFYLNN